MHVCVFLCMSICVKASSSQWMSSFINMYFTFFVKTFHKTLYVWGFTNMSMVSCQEAPDNFLPLSSKHGKRMHVFLYLALFLSSEKPNSGSHTCVANTLLTCLLTQCLKLVIILRAKLSLCYTLTFGIYKTSLYSYFYLF